MFDSSSEEKKFKPNFFSDKFLQEKIRRKLCCDRLEANSVCLLKYFPKYYEHLAFSKENLPRAVESKARQLKVVRHCDAYDTPENDEKTFKKLFQINRKTLKSIPAIGDSSKLWTYFPRVKTINLEKQGWILRDFYQHQSMCGDKSIQKCIESSFGYFWNGCRFVENLEVAPCHDLDLVLIKKIDSSKRFLSFLKRVELEIHPANNNIQTIRNLLMGLMENKDFLRHVTHVRMKRFYETRPDWEVIQSLINCCPQTCFLSFPTGERNREILNRPDQGFCFNLSCLQNLRVLEITVSHFKTFINAIHFPQSLQKITLSFLDHEQSDNLKEFFDHQEREDDEKIEDQDARDWESFEKSKMLSNFFEKWRKLENLRVLNLTLCAFSETDTLMINLILPMLRTIPRLKTFHYQFFRHHQSQEISDRSFDLGVFFSGIETLLSLQHVKIKTDFFHNCVLSGRWNPKKLSPLSSLEINAKIHSQFDLKQFLKGFLGANDPELNKHLAQKTLRLPKLYLFCVRDFIRLLNLMHSVSYFKNFQAHLQVSLVVESIEEMYSHFKYPIYVASNTHLTVAIFIKNFEFRRLTQEEEQYFQRVFGQLQFTVKDANKHYCFVGLFDPDSDSHRILMESK